MPNKNKDTHIFIAYASKDQAAHNTLLSHLNVLKKEIPITIWSEADLMPGAEIEKDIQVQLQQADIVLLLVSSDSLNSAAYENIQSQVQVYTTFVPVLLRPCAWESDPFLKDLQPLPKDRQFISLAKNTDKVYTEIVGKIKKMVLGAAKDTPRATPVKKTLWSKIAYAIIALGLFFYVVAQVVGLITGLNVNVYVSSLMNRVEKSAPTKKEESEPIELNLNSIYGKSIFTTDTSLFKILIIRFEDNLNKHDDTYCIGRSILENLIQLKNKDLPIHPIYADTIASPKYLEEAERLQQHHKADVMIYGLANEIQENCTAANVCFRHIVANTIVQNLGTIKNKRIKHDTEYERMSHRDIEKGKLSVDKQSMEAWVTGLVALKKGDKETYFEEIEKMAADIVHLTKEEQASRFYNRANTYLFSKDYKKAIASFSKSIELKPDDITVYHNRADIYLHLKDYKKAIADYDIIIELEPDDVTAYHNRADIYLHLKDYKKAIANYDIIIELEPDDATVYHNRADTYRHLKDYKKAVADYDKAIELNPGYKTDYDIRRSLMLVLLFLYLPFEIKRWWNSQINKY